MEEHCLGYRALSIDQQEEVLDGLWEELPPPLRERERLRLATDRRLRRLAYDPDRWKTFEEYTYSADFRHYINLAGEQARDRPSIKHEGVSHSSFMVCEGCEYDDGRGHPSQRYHMMPGGCLHMPDAQK